MISAESFYVSEQAVAESIEGCIVMHRGNLDSHRGSRREQEIAPADR